ncbi:MAG: hypothetical protein H6767_02495 [Candidatus Peribacteria bacterium]|nr:MAG: hypothetical protein H6767_02495 [Candidatus Peribacteria bacterium]
MSISVAKKTFSIQKDIATQLDSYDNKSKFVNSALNFYMGYLESVKKYKNSFLEDKIQEALESEFYAIRTSNKAQHNSIQYKNHSKPLEDELLVAINE